MIPTSAPQPRVITKSTGVMFPLGATIVTLLLVVAGSIGLVLLQTPLQQTSQDTRSDASNGGGEVLITTSPITTSKLPVGQEAKIDVQLNTQGKNVTDLQLLFNVITSTTDEVVLTTYSNSDLVVTKQEVEETKDGFLMVFAAKPAAGSTNFTNTSPYTVLSLVFTPKRAGTFKLDFDYDKSRAYTADGDRLRGVGAIEYSAIALSSTGLTCNDACSGNEQCPSNHRCYENRCRLVTNLSSPSCAEPSAALLKCNESCASNSQCANDHVCYQGSCRRADNPGSATCALSSATQQAEIIKSCNQPCTDNRGCAANLLCTQGFCRLATNPSSTSCSTVKDRTVSSYYYGGSSNAQKGSDTPVATARPTASASPNLRPTPSLRPSPSATASIGAVLRVTPTPTLLPTLPPTTAPVITDQTDVTSDTSFLAGIASRLAQGGNQALLLILIALGVLMIVVALILLISRMFAGNSSPTTTVQKKTQTYEAALQEKIEALKQGTPAPTTPTAQVRPPGMTTQTPPTMATHPTPTTVPAPQPSSTAVSSSRPDSVTSTPPMNTLKANDSLRPATPTQFGQSPSQPLVWPVAAAPLKPTPVTPGPVSTPVLPSAPRTTSQPVAPAKPVLTLPPKAPFTPRPSVSNAPLGNARPINAQASLRPPTAALQPLKPLPVLKAETQPHLNLPAHSAAKPMATLPTANQPFSNRPSSMLERMKQRGVTTPGQSLNQNGQTRSPQSNTPFDRRDQTENS